MATTDVELISLEDDCPCTLATCPAAKASRRLAGLRPRQAVLVAADESPLSPFLLLLANDTLSNPQYRRSGVTGMFIRHILQGKTTAGAGRPHWDHCLVGLVNVLASILQAKSQVQDAAILQELHESYANIVEVIWKDFRFLSGKGEKFDMRRSILAKMIAFIGQDAKMKRSMYEERTLKIVLHCWLETALDSPHRKSPMDAVGHIFSLNDFLGNKPPERFLHIAFRAYKITTFISQINFNLNLKTLLGERLEHEIRLICLFLYPDESPFYRYVVEGKVYNQVAAALRRHMKSDQAHDTQMTLEVLEQGGLFVQSLLLHGQMKIFTEVVANTHLVEVGVEALKIANRIQPSSELAWYELFEKISHTMTCKNRMGCAYHATPAFVEAAKASLERIAVTTMRSLQDALVKDTQYLLLWYKLMEVLGITPQSIRERYRVDKKCCNLECPARNMGMRSEKKYSCDVCHSVFYCDRACQRADWEKHKGECARLNNDA